jgi:hypothetical protein
MCDHAQEDLSQSWLEVRQKIKKLKILTPCYILVTYSYLWSNKYGKFNFVFFFFFFNFFPLVTFRGHKSHPFLIFGVTKWSKIRHQKKKKKKKSQEVR